ncbi:MAG: Sir2 histone deacetylase Hst2 [Cirrosporium novae-zelandiae]|nr:MAG: Sir2 histone deacetylase Hst2 [Cirrosporium novae-zelandiae]
MGQEESTPIDESVPPQTLEARTIEAVAKYIKEGRARKIVTMSGAGISTSAGIPDFRTPGTGLYSNLQRLNLPYAEAVFDISYFRSNPLPFYTLAHELYPGKYRPTISHSFVKLLADKGLLLMAFTQNIDTLEREAGVPGDKIVEAHGSFAKESCIDCGKSFPHDLMKEHVDNMTIPHCPQCNGLVKPEIVFFGEALPETFHKNRDLPSISDLAIVMGTSLTVQPFASLPMFVGDGTPRILINMDQVGGLGSRADDVLILGDCDSGVRKLAEKLGWLEELEALWAKTEKKGGKAENKPEEKPAATGGDIEAEVNKLAEEVDKALKISSQQANHLREHLDKENIEAKKSRLPEPESEIVHAERVRTPIQTTETSNPEPEKQPEAPKPGAASDALENNQTGAVESDLTHVFPFLKK